MPLCGHLASTEIGLATTAWVHYSPRVIRLTLLLLASLLVPFTVGCGPNVRKPNLFHPGNLARQQYDAIYFDPYPMDDAGPEIVGGRPREYQRPVPEVVRGRLFNPPSQLAPPPATR